LSAQYPQIPTGSAFAPRIALFYAAIFTALGLQMPLFPLWLKAKGLDAQWIGVVLALPLMVRVAAIPLVTREADRRDTLRGALVLLSIVAAAGYGLLGLAAGPVAIVVIYIMASSAWTPVMPLADAYALKGLRSRAYGPVRLWGSAAFIVASLVAGVLIDLVPGRSLIWFMVLALAAAAAASLAIAPLDQTPPMPKLDRPKLFRRVPGFLAVAAAASLIQASHAVYYGFSTLDWRAAGLDGSVIGVLWALGVVAEIVLFALSGRLPARIGPTMLLAVGGAGATVRWAAMALDPPGWLLPVLQCLHGLSFGATHLGSVGFLAAAAPPGAAATAQGALAVVLGLAMAAAMAVSGQLYGTYGAHAYAAMALFGAAGCATALLAQRRRPA
jgi:PPP family 3-phenylpropionic acid transporter